MKIHLNKYDPSWATSYESLRLDLLKHLAFLNPVIEHIGSTSIAGLTSKPIIDILVGIIDDKLLDSTIEPLSNGYIYYDHEKYNAAMPYRRFFVKLKGIDAPPVYRKENDNEWNDFKQAHIHIVKYGTQHWIRHVAFRDYLLQHDEVRKLYEDLKIRLSQLEWKDGNEYNSAKNDFIKKVECDAVAWYKNGGVPTTLPHQDTAL